VRGEDQAAQRAADNRAAYGVGADTAAQLLVTAGTNPHRLRNEAAGLRVGRHAHQRDAV
jgi:hypothetical protein